MGTFIGVAVIILIAIIFSGKKHSKINTANSQQPINFTKIAITGCVVQILESVYILENSEQIDTIIGRYDSLKIRVNELSDLKSTTPGFTSYVQEGIDLYKRTYYDRIPSEIQLVIVTHPELSQLDLLFKGSIGRAIMTHYRTQSSQIMNLTRKDAILRRKNKLIDVCDLALKSLKDECVDIDDLNELIEMIKSNVRSNVFNPG